MVAYNYKTNMLKYSFQVDKSVVNNLQTIELEQNKYMLTSVGDRQFILNTLPEDEMENGQDWDSDEDEKLFPKNKPESPSDKLVLKLLKLGSDQEMYPQAKQTPKSTDIVPENI